jgi:hypothetical protein
MLQYVTIYYNMLRYVTIYYDMLQYITICYNMLQYVTIYYNMLQYITICYFKAKFSFLHTIPIMPLVIQKFDRAVSQRCIATEILVSPYSASLYHIRRPAFFTCAFYGN